MINRKDNFPEWIQLVDELDDAKDHLSELSQKMSEEDDFDEEEFKIYLGHIYTHLNRVWNSRNSTKGLVEENWEIISKLPENFEPVG